MQVNLACYFKSPTTCLTLQPPLKHLARLREKICARKRQHIQTCMESRLLMNSRAAFTNRLALRSNNSTYLPSGSTLSLTTSCIARPDGRERSTKTHELPRTFRVRSCN